MDRQPHGASAGPGPLIGLLACSLMALVAISWAAGWAWLAIPSAMAALGVSAIVAGRDSREPGDWTRAGAS
jgi:hypothetical protein